MVTHAQAKWPDATHEALEQGLQLFTTKCNTCHALPDVRSESADEWPKIIEKWVKTPNSQKNNHSKFCDSF